jgi:hypothetical protein
MKTKAQLLPEKKDKKMSWTNLLSIQLANKWGGGGEGLCTMMDRIHVPSEHTTVSNLSQLLWQLSVLPTKCLKTSQSVPTQ